MKNGLEVFRLVTPLLVSINLFMQGLLWAQLSDMNAKIYHHQTNAEIHTPRAELLVLRHDVLEQLSEIQKQLGELIQRK